MSKAVALTRAALAAPKDLRDMLELEPVQANWIGNLIKTQGITEERAVMQYEREKLLFFKAITTNSQLEKCDRFSLYSSWIELAVSGTTLNEGESYIIPYKDKAQFQVGYKGRIRQMQEIPGFEFVNMPQVVYSCDTFAYELGENPRVVKHMPASQRTKDDVLTHVYLVIDMINGKKKTFIMSAEDVYAIRDRYSQTYNSYVSEITKQNKKIGESVTKQMRGKNGGNDWTLTIDPPMWVTSEPEAWKKTIVKRAYKWVPKTPKLRAIDAVIGNNFDPEDGTQGEQEAFAIDYNMSEEAGVSQPAAPAGNTAAAEPKAKATRTTKAKENPAPAATPPPSANQELDEMQNAGNTQDVEHEEITDAEQGYGAPDDDNGLGAY